MYNRILGWNYADVYNLCWIHEFIRLIEPPVRLATTEKKRCWETVLTRRSHLQNPDERHWVRSKEIIYIFMFTFIFIITLFYMRQFLGWVIVHTQKKEKEIKKYLHFLSFPKLFDIA